MIGYYDMILGLIPLTLVGVTGTLHGIGLESGIAVPLAAIVAAALVGHALFVKAPVSATAEVDPEPPVIPASD